MTNPVVNLVVFTNASEDVFARTWNKLPTFAAAVGLAGGVEVVVVVDVVVTVGDVVDFSSSSSSSSLLTVMLSKLNSSRSISSKMLCKYNRFYKTSEPKQPNLAETKHIVVRPHGAQVDRDRRHSHDR